jgi:predicted histidine transporter YuiF (NhaC family)
MILFISGLLIGLLLGLLYCRRASRIAVSNYAYNEKAKRTAVENQATRTELYHVISTIHIAQKIKAYAYSELPITNEKINAVVGGIMNIIVMHDPVWRKR